MVPKNAEPAPTSKSSKLKELYRWSSGIETLIADKFTMVCVLPLATISPLSTLNYYLRVYETQLPVAT